MPTFRNNVLSENSMKDLRSTIPSLPVNLLLKNLSADLICDNPNLLPEKIGALSSLDISLQIFANSNQHSQYRTLPIKDWSTDSNEKKVVFLHLENIAETKSFLLQAEQKNHLTIVLNHENIQGNLELPLSFKNGDLEISLHHKGRGDRRARATLQYLKHKTTNLNDAILTVIGTDHNFLTLEDREPYHSNGPKYQNLIESLKLISGLQEFFVLNTCNRIEIYAISSQNREVINLIKKVMDFDHLNEDQFYTKYDCDAFNHLCMVSSGMYAQIPGESHVVQQLKTAFQFANDRSLAGGLLQQIFDNALFVSKFIRNKTASLTSKFEIEDIATQYALKVLNNISNKNIIILGSGVVGKGILERILPHKPNQIIIFYRSNRPDLSLFDASVVSAHPIDDLIKHLPNTDVIFSAVTSNRFVLHSLHMTHLKKPVEVIDVCVPRTVDPMIANQPEITLIDTESLKKWHLSDLKNLEQINQTALKEIEQRMGRYEKIYDKEWLQE